MTTQELRDQIYGVLESRDVMGGDSKVVLVDRIEELIIDRSRQAQLAILDQVQKVIDESKDAFPSHTKYQYLLNGIDDLQATLKGEQE